MTWELQGGVSRIGDMGVATYLGTLKEGLLSVIFAKDLDAVDPEMWLKLDLKSFKVYRINMIDS